MQLTLKSPANEDEAIELISHLVACMLAYFQDVLILINKLMLAMRNKKIIGAKYSLNIRNKWLAP